MHSTITTEEQKKDDLQHYLRHSDPLVAGGVGKLSCMHVSVLVFNKYMISLPFIDGVLRALRQSAVLSMMLTSNSSLRAENAFSC
jgi:hypothetical protein